MENIEGGKSGEVAVPVVYGEVTSGVPNGLTAFHSPIIVSAKGMNEPNARLANALKWTPPPGPRMSQARRATVSAYIKKRRARDFDFQIVLALRCRLRAALKGQGRGKRTMEMLGCTIGELKAHLAAQFDWEMTWENYGEWQIDHIRPCCSFDLSDLRQQEMCFHFSNLQPLWAEQNQRKGGKWKGK